MELSTAKEIINKYGYVSDNGYEYLKLLRELALTQEVKGEWGDEYKRKLSEGEQPLFDKPTPEETWCWNNDKDFQAKISLDGDKLIFELTHYTESFSGNQLKNVVFLTELKSVPEIIEGAFLRKLRYRAERLLEQEDDAVYTKRINDKINELINCK